MFSGSMFFRFISDRLIHGVYRPGSQPAPSHHNSLWESEYFHLQYVHHLQNHCHCKETIFPSYVDWILSSSKTTIKVPCHVQPLRLVSTRNAAPHIQSLEIIKNNKHHRQNPHKSPSIPPKFPAQTSICKAHRSNSPKTQLGPRQMDLRS